MYKYVIVKCIYYKVQITAIKDTRSLRARGSRMDYKNKFNVTDKLCED